jgi:hypothetical protein
MLIKGSDNAAISLMTNPVFTPILCHIGRLAYVSALRVSTHMHTGQTCSNGPAGKQSAKNQIDTPHTILHILTIFW